MLVHEGDLGGKKHEREQDFRPDQSVIADTLALKAGFGLKGVFGSVERMVKCPSSLAFTTDDIGHDLCDRLTLGRSTDT